MSVALLALAACSSPASAPIHDRTLRLLQGDEVEVDGVRASLEVGIARLGDASTTRVVIEACATHSMMQVYRVTRSLEAAGYTHIRYAKPAPEASSRCSGR